MENIKNNDFDFETIFSYKLIYVFRINDKKHKGCLKIGETSLNYEGDRNNLFINCETLNKAAKKRIDQYTTTAAIDYELLHTELAINNKNHAFRDRDIHRVLEASGIKKKKFDKKSKEWYIVDLETVKNAIKAVKESRKVLENCEKTNDLSPIIFRPEQKNTIEETTKKLSPNKYDKILWNAKMRFGKTLCALEVIKRKEFINTIIISHRPVVKSGWQEDYNKIFYDRKDFLFLTKENKDLLEDNKFKKIYFASIQDLRGSEKIGGNFKKNDDVFNMEWDFLIVDEAHDGTTTQLGRDVIDKINKRYTLLLSGTPYVLMNNISEEQTITWDYIKEQEAKRNWEINNFGDSNPYSDLPKLNIHIYDLKNYSEIKSFLDNDKAFSFSEFFRVWSGDKNKDDCDVDKSLIGKFVHEKDVNFFYIC
ncbi:DEAD/DEAH box helicase [Mycoplasma feriruminatoris]|uniref:DEAD/DEAH box helicase n=1 Tax=Mycoplasma feriruminatoris TaxID=1179777 RepID=UPI0002A51E87|nr:DEAD/DEAH box helicase family protein [Mycoplasma feriruminatoris]UKS53955.1 type III restriction enzyme, res subunit [Mycoplasma feriruminatoris]VZK65141.1 hypothetical protein MF5292_00306 [Mycoplasma feriruminatoris]VZR75287.1 hypothetical protein MF5294_00307 [Mycoplasma feriruminatoris]VZR97407.1 hypothetical protein MF5293_00306 [Mycoplasma feriruminatoris]